MLFRSVERAVAQTTGLGIETRRRLIHAILAHHGKLEYGSPVLPMTLEALVVHHADQMDSAVRGAWEQLQAEGGQGDFTGASMMHDTRLYRGSTAEDQAQTTLWP